MDIFDFDSDSESEFYGFNNVTGDLSDIEVSSVSSVSSEESDNNQDDFQLEEPEWISDNFTHVDTDPFTQNIGPNLPDTFDAETATPVDYFKLFLTDDILAEVTRNSNRYASYLDGQKKLKNPNYVNKTWYPCEHAEIQAYFGLNIMFGLTKAPSLRSYWSSDQFLGNEGVKSVMTCRRFEALSECLHINDRESEIPKHAEHYDILAKVRPLMKKFSKSFPLYMYPSREQAIDEGMVAFKGRVKYLQYMKMKPVKRGIKVWIRADSPSGYVQQFDVYLGSRKKQGLPASKNGVYFDVVDNLCKPLFYNNHCIYFDNLYTSIPLLLHLLHNDVYACGTIRANKKYLPDLVRKPGKMARGEMKVFQDEKSENLTACVWQDTKQVRFASTCDQADNAQDALRRVAGQNMPVLQPQAAHSYGKFMGAVDLFDMLRSKYKTGRCSKKSWKYLLWFLIDAAVVNAFILHKQATRRPLPPKYCNLTFRHELAIGLIAGFSSRHRKRGPQPTHMRFNAVENVHDHGNEHMMRGARKCCHHAKKYPTHAPKRTVYGCTLCKVHLCKECHYDFHIN